MIMALLKSVTNVPDINYYEYKDSLFYNKYKYRLRMHVDGVRYTYWCNTTQDLKDKINGNHKRSYFSIKPQDADIVFKNINALNAFIEINNERKTEKNYTVRLEGNRVSIFSNDLDQLKNMEKRIGSKYKLDYTEAHTHGFSGVKYFVNEPKYKYRIYLKSKRINESIFNDLIDTLKKQKKIYPSKALQKWLNRDESRYHSWSFLWTSSGHFMEYDEESTYSYLSLVHGDILGKKYKLEKRPDTV